MIDVEPWGEFAVAMVGAGAVLAGFVFVALSINLDRILSTAGLPSRAAETLIIFAGVLVVSAVLLVPDQEAGAVGTELLLVGLVQAAVLTLLVPRGRGAGAVQPLSWTLTRLVTNVVVSVPVVLGGVLVLAGWEGSLYLVAAAVLLAVVAGLANTWVLSVEIVRDERYRPGGSADEPR